MNTNNHDLGNRRILVIDDNPAIHADFRKILCTAGNAEDLSKAESELFGETSVKHEKQGYEVASAHQGQEGLEAVRVALEKGTPYAMAFVDVRMPPGWDGVETVTRIWQVDPDLQIVICTAYSDYSWDEMIARVGGSDRLVILKKPFDMVEVLQLANAFTEKWSLLQQSRVKLRDLEAAVVSRTSELQDFNAKLQREVTEREHTEQALRTAQEKLNRFLAKSPAVLYSFRYEAGRPVPAWVTENFATLTGGDAEDWYSQAADLGYVEPTDRQGVTTRLDLLPERGHLSVDYRICHRDGSLRWVRDDRQLLLDDSGAPVEIVGCLTDITERRLLEEQLQQAQKMECVGQLAGGVAHDFNNLLMVILGHLDLLIRDEQVPEPIGESLLRIQGAAQRAGNLTRQLLAFSRKQVMRTRPVDMNEMIESMAHLLGRTLGEHITIQTECEAGLPAALADPAMIEQVIMNLAVNARDAMPQGGQLVIRTSAHIIDKNLFANPEVRPGRYVCLSVSDTGCGIAPENQARIFEPFFTTKKLGKGTGLGLATVYGNVRQHSGWIEVESQLGHGTAIKVFLPFSESVSNPVKAVKPKGPAHGGRETILVVEDESAVRSLIHIVLRRLGYKVHTAVSGTEALAGWAGRLNEVQLLITDIVMPDGLSGWDLARELQALKPSLKTIYISGYNAEMTTGKPELGPDICFLAKPFSPQKLTEAVRDQLDGVSTPAQTDAAVCD